MTAASDYEELTRDLARNLSNFFGVLTKRCEKHVVMVGRGTSNEVDVLWEGQIDGSLHRIIIECKHYTRRVDQSKLHAFRSVLDDLADDVPTTGVFVTTQGYQSGAQALAETYGIVVLELRPPRSEDVAGRVTQIKLSILARMEVVDDIQVDGTWLNDAPAAEGLFDVEPDHVSIVSIDGSVTSLRSSLTDGERSPLRELPTPPHRVFRIYAPGTMLALHGSPVMSLRAISAVVGDSDSQATQTIGPGAEGIAHILKDAVTGATVWIQKDGRMRLVS